MAESTPIPSLELDLADPRLDQVRFGRSRLLRFLGAGLAGMAASVATKRPAYAHHYATPTYCFGYGACHCCSGATCCASNCVGHSHSHGCPTGSQCWTTYVPIGNGCYRGYRCCDWHQGTTAFCICRQTLYGQFC